MPDTEKSLKAINFDLDTKSLKKYYPSPNWRKAYEDINKFLLTNGFEHRQGSGYVSNQSMENTTVIFKIEILARTFSWFPKSVKRFNVTDIGEQFDMLDIINGAASEMDIESVELSDESEYISKLEEIEDIADTIQDAIDNGELDMGREEQSRGQER